MDGVESQLVALEKFTSSFSHFIIKHWIPTQAVLVDLHNSTCPGCQRADGMADDGYLASESLRSRRTAPIPIPLPNSRQGDSAPLLSPVPSLISDSSADSTPPFFFVGVRERAQRSAGLSIYIDKASGSLSFFFGGNEREVGSNEDLSEASEESGYGSGAGGVSEGPGGH